jgi:hypothetical protein
MAANAGPKINREGIALYIDGRNEKSYLENGNIKSLITNQTLSTNLLTDERGFLYNDSKEPEALPGLQLTEKNAITVTILINEKNNNYGTAFSIIDKEIPIYKYSTGSTTSVLSNTINTLGTEEVSTIKSSDSFNELLLYMSSSVTTLSTGTVSSGATLSSSQNTITSSSTVNTSATTEILHDTLYTDEYPTINLSSTVTTSALKNESLLTSFELSFYVKSNDVFVKNNNNEIDSSLFSDSDGVKNIYTAVFRSLNDTGKPISFYKNGRLVSESNEQGGVTELKNGQIKIFNTNYSFNSNYKIGLVLIHDRELNSSEISLLRSLKGD